MDFKELMGKVLENAIIDSTHVMGCSFREPGGRRKPRSVPPKRRGAGRKALRVYVGICGDFWGFHGPTTPRLNRFDPNGCNQVGTDAGQVLAHLRTHGGCDVALLEGVLEWKNGCLELHAREVKFIPEPAGVEAGAGASPKALPPSSSRSPCSSHHAPPLEGAKTPARRRKAPMGGRTQEVRR